MTRRAMHHVLAAVAMVAPMIGAASMARAQSFTIHNASDSQISVGFAVSDPSCETGFRNRLWFDVGPRQERRVDGIDTVNAFLLTAIHFRDGGFRTIAHGDSLKNFIWDTPTSGSTECATYRGPGEHYGYSVYNLSCNSMISHPGMFVQGPSGTVPVARVGCINSISGPAGPDVPCVQDPDQPECEPE